MSLPDVILDALLDSPDPAAALAELVALAAARGIDLAPVRALRIAGPWEERAEVLMPDAIDPLVDRWMIRRDMLDSDDSPSVDLAEVMGTETGFIEGYVRDGPIEGGHTDRAAAMKWADEALIKAGWMLL